MKLEFHWNDVTKELLLEKGFKYSRAYSSDDGDAYIGTWTVYRWNMVDVLIARIVVWLDGQVKIDILDKGTRGLYSTYYTYDAKRAPIITKIDRNLSKILKDLGVINVRSKDKTTAQQRKDSDKRFSRRSGLRPLQRNGVHY